MKLPNLNKNTTSQIQKANKTLEVKVVRKVWKKNRINDGLNLYTVYHPLVGHKWNYQTWIKISQICYACKTHKVKDGLRFEIKSKSLKGQTFHLAGDK